MRQDTKDYCDSQMARVREAVQNQQGYLLKDEFQQVIYEFRRANARCPAWVVKDDAGYFFPISYDDFHLFTFASKNHALDDLSEYLSDSENFIIDPSRISPARYRYDWVNPDTGDKLYSCFIQHPTDDVDMNVMIVDVIRHIVEFKNACLESSGSRYSPFLDNPPASGSIRKKRRKPYIER